MSWRCNMKNLDRDTNSRTMDRTKQLGNGNGNAITSSTTTRTNGGDTTPTRLPRVGARRQNNNEKGLYEWIIFTAAVATGTACSILSKVLYETKDDRGHYFNKPIAQTLAMFLAMILGLPLHWTVIYCKIPFPGYDRFYQPTSSTNDKLAKNNTSSLNQEGTPLIAATPKVGHKSFRGNDEEMQYPLPPPACERVHNNNADTRIPLKTYFYLLIPALFDCLATVLCMIGLLFLDVSIYQLLRGSGIIFVALLRQHYLREHLFHFQWTGVAWNVASVVLVGATALLNSSTSHDQSGGNLEQAMLGVLFMLAGSLVQSMMFVFEEKVMNLDEVKVPPLLLFGMEGFWGAIMTVTVLYPIGYYTYGNDKGSFEDPWSTWEMVKNTRSIQVLLSLYLMAIFGYNLFAVLITFSLSSVWHSILDNFRPMTVWITDLVIYYALTRGSFGEPWKPYSSVQLVGLVILIYGTMVYNAPDPGSIRLGGEWYSFGCDFSHEYQEIQAHRWFSMGSYPSLQRFLTASSGGSLHGFDRRIVTSMRENTSPRINYGSLLLKEQHSV